MKRRKYMTHYVVYAESTDGIILGVGETNYRKALKKFESIKRIRKYAKVEEYIVDRVIYGATHIDKYYDEGLVLNRRVL